MSAPLEAADEAIDLARAATIAGLAASTLRRQARRGKLRVAKRGGALLTTRRWLHEYLTGRDGRRGAKPAPLPEDYCPPAQDALD